MEVSFDTDKRGKNIPLTRIYVPYADRDEGTDEAADRDSLRRPRRLSFDEADEIVAEAPAAPVKKDPTPLYSYILLVLTVFIIAGSAILAISGNEKVAKVQKQIYSLNSEIDEYEEKISMLKKEQSSLNDYATINNANKSSGRIMNWEEDKTVSGR